MYGSKVVAVAALLSASVSALPTAHEERNIFDDIFGGPPAAPENNFGCKSDRNPVVMLHGLFGNKDFGSELQQQLNSLGWCTYTFTYGIHPLFPTLGGVGDMHETSREIADFVRKVHDASGGKKVDIVGHSEGGVQSIYVPMTQGGIADIVERAIALGPAVHGARYYGLADLTYIGGEVTRKLVATLLKTVGCKACDDLAVGGDITNEFTAAAGRISRPPVKLTIVTSATDILVPADTSRVDEPGVRFLTVQDYCQDDKTGHSGLITDRNVWEIIKNELSDNYSAKVGKCDYEHISPF